jgi:hypothetical protein
MEDKPLRARNYLELAKHIRMIAEDVRGEAERKKLISAAREFKRLGTLSDAKRSRPPERHNNRQRAVQKPDGH